MTEQEWLKNEDPAAMVHDLERVSHEHRDVAEISDRKLRLFACACWRAYRTHWLTGKATAGFDPAALLAAITAAESFADNPVGMPVMTDWPLDGSGEASARETVRRIGGSVLAKQVMAALLRDIVGTPWRPVTLPRPYVTPKSCGHYFDGRGEISEGYCGCKTPSIGMNTWSDERRERQWACSPFYHVQDKDRGPCPWLTPTVLNLAQAAYEARPGRECGADCVTLPNPGESMQGKRLVHRGYPGGWDVCSTCGGTGRIDDGSLDNDNLAVLSDALEEAGCSHEEACRGCRGEGGCWTGDNIQTPVDWWECDACGGSGRVPHPLLAHLRSPGPHVRGCWALDLIRGKE